MVLAINRSRRLEKITNPDLKDLLLASEARTETLTQPGVERDHRTRFVIE